MNHKFYLLLILSLIVSGCSTTKLADNKDGTVTISNNNLVVLKCVSGQSWNGNSCTGLIKTMNWWQAMEEAKNSRVLGHNDWRLPTEDELVAIETKFDACELEVDYESFFWSVRRSDSPDYAFQARFGKLSCIEQRIHSSFEKKVQKLALWMLPSDDVEIVRFQFVNRDYQVRLVRGGSKENLESFNQQYANIAQEKAQVNSIVDGEKTKRFFLLTSQLPTSAYKPISSADIYSEEGKNAAIHLYFDGMSISQVSLALPDGFFPCDPRRFCSNADFFYEPTPEYIPYANRGVQQFEYFPYPLKSQKQPTSFMYLDAPSLFEKYLLTSDRFIFIAYNKYGDKYKFHFYKRNMTNNFISTK